MRAQRAFALFFAVLTGGDAFALEWTPEFQSLTEAEESNIESPYVLGPEYASDMRSYRKSVAWEYDWLTHRYGFDTSMGSISAAHFMMDQRLKVHADLADFLEFRFTFTDERSREREAVHHVVELVAWPWKFLGVSAYGEASLYKRDDDTGLALILRPWDTHEIRIFNTFVDVTRLKRNDRHDTYLEPDLPYSRGFVGRLWTPRDSGRRDFLEYAGRYDTFTRWYFPDQQYEFDYRKFMGSLFGTYGVTERVSLSARIQHDRKFENKFPTEAKSSVAYENWTTSRTFAILGAALTGVLPWDDWELRPGLELMERVWQTNLGDARYRDLLPSLEVKFPGFGTDPKRDHVTAGYVATWHRVWAPAAMLEPGDDPSVQHRLNLSYEFNFGERAKLLLMATGDLDEFFTARSWDGGNAQFQLLF